MLCPILSVEQDTEYRNSSITTKRKDSLFPIHDDKSFARTNTELQGAYHPYW